ncbi:MAG TPA: PEP-CTERM sorting domain-containing protein [Lacipirellulaceae bacterium]
MMRRISVFAVVCAVVFATGAVQAAPVFWLSADGTDTTPGMFDRTGVPANSTGTVNIFANTDVRLSGVSLDLVETGGGIKFTSAELLNPSSRWVIAGTPTVSDSSVLSLSGGAIPGVAGGGIGPGSPDTGPGVLFATVNYMANATGTSNLMLRVGDLVIADWDGNNPMVGFGDGPTNIPGGVPGGSGPVGQIMVGGGVTPVMGTDANLGDVANAIITHQFAATGGTAPLTWSNLALVAGSPTPAVAPTLSSTGAFEWHTIGSPRPGTYSWNATVTDSANPATTDLATLTLNLIVPEPATMSLVGLAMIGLVGLARRRIG